MLLETIGSKQTILLVHSMNPSKKFVLERIKGMGLNLVCLNKEKMDWALPYVDCWILADLQNQEECIEAVKKYNVENSNLAVCGAVTFWDEAILLTARITDEFGLVGIPYQVAQQAKNKNKFREFCTDCNLPAPAHRLLHNKEEILNLDKYLSYPLVIKPIYGASSAYVVRVENEEELLRAYDYIKNNIKTFWLAPEWESVELLAEEYIGGSEVDIDILLQDGNICYISLNDNKQTNEPYFVETGWSGPSALSENRQYKLIELSNQIIEALGVRNGCIHFEAKSMDDGKAVPIEINLRMGGGEVFMYSKNIWGVDLVENAIKIALNQPLKIDKTNQPLAFLISHRFLSNTTCVVKDILVDKALYEKKYLVDIYFEKHPGDIFKAPPEGYDRSIGVITVQGGTPEEANDNLADAFKMVSCIVE